MEPATMTKRPTEVRVYEFNFSKQKEITTGAVITSIVSLASTPSGLTVGTPAIGTDDVRVQVQLSGGTSGARYLLKCLVELDGGPKRLEMSGVCAVQDVTLPSV